MCCLLLCWLWAAVYSQLVVYQSMAQSCKKLTAYKNGTTLYSKNLSKALFCTQCAFHCFCLYFSVDHDLGYELTYDHDYTYDCL